MTVFVPPERLREFSADEKRAVVEGYYSQPWGMRKRWLEAEGIPYGQLTVWKSQYAGGNLETGLTPRENVSVNEFDIVEVKRLKEQMAKLLEEKEQLEKQLADQDARLAEKDVLLRQRDEQTAAHARAVESLGKAIAIMQKRIDS